MPDGHSGRLSVRLRRLLRLGVSPGFPPRDLLVEVFTQQCGHAPKIEAIHAGVECGICAGKLPGLDCVSLDPDLAEIHTCRERLHIASVQRLWAMLPESLKRMK